MHPAAGPIAERWLALTARLPAGVALVSLLLAACSPRPDPVQPVEPPRRLSVSGQETVSVPVFVPADVAVELRLRSRDVDVRVELATENGGPATAADAPNDRLGVITCFLPPDASRNVELKVIGQDHARNRGEVTLEILALPSRSIADRRRQQAVRLLSDASVAYAHLDGGRDAAQRFGGATDLLRSIGDDREAGLALLQEAGTRLTRLGEWEHSRRLAARAGKLLQETGEPELETRALRLEGAALSELAGTLTGKARARTFLAATERLSKAAELAIRHDLPYEAAYAFNYRGVAHQYSGETRLAQGDYERALKFFKAAGHAPGVALSTDSLALLHYEDGDLRQALERFDEALALSSPAESPVNYASTLSNSALPLRALGRFQEAIERYRRSADLFREAGDPTGQARALQGIAMVLRYTGEPDRARILLREAVRLHESTGSTRDLFAALAALADIEREAGHSKDAGALLNRARQLASTAPDRARVLLSLAQLQLARREPELARPHLDEVLRLQLPATHRLLEQAWQQVAEVEALARHDAEARRAFSKALSIAIARGSELEQSLVLAARAHFSLDLKRPDEAMRDSARAIELLQFVGATGLHAQQRAVFLATQRRVYEVQIAAQLAIADQAQRDGRVEQAADGRAAALLTSEQSRMSGFLEELATPINAVPAKTVRRRYALYELLAGKRQRLEAALDAAPPDSLLVLRLSRDIELLRVELGIVEGLITRTTGHRTEERPSLRELMAAVPADTAVFEYFIGESRGWVFAARSGQVSVHELPPPEEIEDSQRRLLEQWRSPVESATSPSLTAMLRIFPAELQGGAPMPQIWIVPDAGLHALPFAATVREGLRGGWISDAEIEVIPSLTTVALAASRPRRSRTGNSPLVLALFADPVVSSNDDRIARVARRAITDTRSEAGPQAIHTLTSTRIDSLQRLPATANEARAIAALLPSSSSHVFVGTDVTRDSIADVAGARYLHFATHALADPDDPELSALILSRYSADGTPRDGVLRRLDLANLRLDADLVVLSGCETALGREIRGEGLVGLTYGFLQAGARSVVASVWPVPDSSTAVLMVEFYRQMLVLHRAPSVALRRAQDFVRSHPRWAQPYFWAGFQLISMNPTATNAATPQQARTLQ